MDFLVDGAVENKKACFFECLHWPFAEFPRKHETSFWGPGLPSLNQCVELFCFVWLVRQLVTVGLLQQIQSLPFFFSPGFSIKLRLEIAQDIDQRADITPHRRSNTYPFLRSLTQHWFPIILHTPLLLLKSGVFPEKPDHQYCCFLLHFLPNTRWHLHPWDKLTWGARTRPDPISSESQQCPANVQDVSCAGATCARGYEDLGDQLGNDSILSSFVFEERPGFGSLEVLFFLSASCQW